MAYVQQHSASSNAKTLGAVAALHLIGIYAVVSGLAVNPFITKPPPPLAGYQFPTDSVPKPTPTPVPPKPDTDLLTDKVVTDTPVPPVGGNPPSPFDLGATGGETGAGGGELGGVEFPTPTPTPFVADPVPRFTAAGPKARGSQSTWVRQSDYPSRAIHLGHEGITGVRLEVGLSGKVDQCSVIRSSGWDELDAAACAKLRDRARFDPATGTDGAATAGSFNTSVRWQLPQ